jgi:hypothetical protein
MNTAAEASQPPRFGHVVREQIRATALSLRIPAMIGGVLVALATVISLADHFSGRGTGVEFAPELSLMPAFAGVILAVTSWLAQRRQKSEFFWSMPVDRSQHALAKVVAGWIILMIVVTGFVLWLLILALVTKGNITGDEMINLLPPGTEPPWSPADLDLMTRVRWVPQPILWLTPFTAATGTYAIASGVMIGVRHPLRWIAAIIATFFLIAAIAQGLASQHYWQEIGDVVDAVMRGPYGLDGLMSAGAESAKTSAAVPGGDVISVWYRLPSVRDWMIATILWTSFGMVGLGAGLWRHRERR